VELCSATRRSGGGADTHRRVVLCERRRELQQVLVQPRDERVQVLLSERRRVLFLVCGSAHHAAGADAGAISRGAAGIVPVATAQARVPDWALSTVSTLSFS